MPRKEEKRVESYFYENKPSPFRVAGGESFDFPPHLHHQVEMCIQLRGEQEVSAGGEHFLMHSNDVALILPNTVHSYRRTGPGRCILVIFDPSFAGPYMEQLMCGRCDRPFVENAHADVMLALMRLAQEKEIGENLASAYIGIAVGRVLADLTLKEESTVGEVDILRRVLADINEHIEERITLDILAGRLYLNRYSISRLFSERMGCGLNDYINTLRADRAHNLLKNPSLPLDEVIRRSGFESERTFYRVFREKYGCSPRQYVQSIREGQG